MTLLLALALSVSQQAAASSIPADVRYKPASPGLNKWTRELLVAAFDSKGKRFADPALYGNVVTCGPFLWKSLVSNNAIKTPEKGRTIFVVSGPGGKQVQMAGRRFFANDVGEFQQAVAPISPPAEYVVRAPTADELRFYWVMIPYDITEPIFTVEGEGHRFLVDFFGSEHVFLIEDISSAPKAK